VPESRSHRRATRRIASVAAGAGIAALLLSGCVGVPATTVTPSASETIEPIFASDEEALAAAEAAYRAFESVSHTIASDSGRDAERINAVATPAYVPELLDEFAKYSEIGIRAEGTAQVDSFSLVENSMTDSGATVSIYVCRDVSQVRVIDGTGADVTPPGREARTPLIAVLMAERGKPLLVDEVDLWSGDDFC